MKIRLQFPGKFSDSPYYKGLIENPPNSIKYNTDTKIGLNTTKKKFNAFIKLKRLLRRIYNQWMVCYPNVQISYKAYHEDLIHCAHCLSGNNVNWVADFEDVWQMFIGERTPEAYRKVRDILNDINCKKIIAWTDACRNNIIELFPDIVEKVVTIYPAVKVPTQKKVKSDKIRLLFVARYFEHKGGNEIIKIFDKITKKYENVEATIVSDIPKDVFEEYNYNPRLRLIDLVDQEYLYNHIYPEADLLVYPGTSDSFGFAMLEAMSFGIPVITKPGFARDEIIWDGCNGIITEDIEKSIIDNLDKDKINKMSESARKSVEVGRFSIKQRNRKLREVYLDARKN